MTEWARTVDFYLDVDPVPGASSLLNLKTSSPLTSFPFLVQGDVVTLRLFFRRRSSSVGGASSAMTLPGGSNLLLRAKLASALDDGDVLFSCDLFSQSGTGDDICYVGTVSLATQELTTAFASTSPTSITARVDVEVQNAGNSARTTIQFDVTVKQEVAGSDVYPQALVVPAFPYQEEFTYAGAKCIRLRTSDGIIVAQFAPPGVTLP